MSHDVTQVPEPLTDAQIAERLQEITPPTPIGRARFGVALPGLERSKPAVLRENQVLRTKLINMQQLLAAMLLEQDEESVSFLIEDLEAINPRMVDLQLTETHATLSLKEIDEPEAELPEPA